MVKNYGGNKGKKQGRKHVIKHSDTGHTSRLRMALEAGEVYAMVTKMFGNGMCSVKCLDNTEKMCVIRNKFRGRNKRHNMIVLGTWLLVGLRDWEVRSDENKQRCDVLEVYSDHDKKNLINNAFKDFTIFTSGERGRCVNHDNDDVFSENINDVIDNVTDSNSSDKETFTVDADFDFDDI